MTPRPVTPREIKNLKNATQNYVKSYDAGYALCLIRRAVANRISRQILLRTNHSSMESNDGAKRSATTSRNKPPSRPTTPLRSGSRTSLRDSQGYSTGRSCSDFPLDSLEPGFVELSDSMADLEANFMHLQLMHESLSRFNESFASFLYGLNMNAFCVDFPEVS